MKRIWFAVIILLVGLVAGFSAGFAAHSAKATGMSESEPTTAQLLTLVNAERARHGVAPLKEDARLDATAQIKASDEIAYNYYDHVSPQGSPYAGMQGYHLIDATGLKCSYESENLDENDTAVAAVQAWISSPAHHAAMIGAEYTLTGFGIAGKDTHGHYQLVEHFCQVL